MLEGLTAGLPDALPLHMVRPDGLDSFLGGLPPATAAYLRATAFTAKSGEHALLPGPDGLAGAVVGLGTEASPWSCGGLAHALPAGSAWRLVAGTDDAGLATLGWALGAYRPRRHKAAGTSWTVEECAQKQLDDLEDPEEGSPARPRTISSKRSRIRTFREKYGAKKIVEITAADRARLDGVSEPEQAIVPYYTGKLIDFKSPVQRW